MQSYKSKFINDAYESGALQFGEFRLNSGRISPFFFNTGKFSNGKTLNAIANAYVDTILSTAIDFDMIYGPAYKGIPLATSISQVLYQRQQLTIPFVFNRKERKDHGETGVLIGSEIHGKVLIIDDVISSGISLSESIQTIKKNKGEVAGILIALDRKEKKVADVIEEDLSIIENTPMFSIIDLFDIMDFVKQKSELKIYLDLLASYHEKYGVDKIE